MDIFKIGIIGITAVILAITIKNQSPQIALLISLITGVIIFILILPALEEVITSIFNIVRRLDISIGYIGIILKIIGISYISEFCSQICQDAGETAIASKIELGGKVLIMLISVPVITELLDLINRIIP